MKSPQQITVICVILAVHAVISMMLIAGLPETKPPENVLLFLLAWPLGQVSLIAIWAALSRLRSYVRFPVALLGAAGAWFLTITLLEVDGMDGEETAPWAAMVVTQAAIIVIFTMLGGLVWQWIKRRRGDTSEDPQALQYGISTLLIWTAVLAATLGLGRTAFAALGWTPEVLKFEYFLYCPVLGFYNAVCALLVLASLVGRAWLIRRILAAGIFVAVLAYTESYGFVFLFGETGGIKTAECLILTGSQAVYIYATLLPLRLCACFGVASGGLRAAPACGIMSRGLSAHSQENQERWTPD